MDLRGLHQQTVLVKQTVQTTTVIRGLHQQTVLVKQTAAIVRNILITVVNQRHKNISNLYACAVALRRDPSNP